MDKNFKYKVTINVETARGVLKQVEVFAEQLIDVSRILLTFNAKKGDTIYRYVVESCEMLV